MARDEAKEQTFQTLWNVRHTLFRAGSFPLLVWRFKKFFTSPWPFLAVIEGGLGVRFIAPLLKIRYFAPVGENSIGLFRLLVTE